MNEKYKDLALEIQKVFEKECLHDMVGLNETYDEKQ